MTAKKKWKTTSTKREDDLKKNGRQPPKKWNKTFKKWKTTYKKWEKIKDDLKKPNSKKIKMEDDLNHNLKNQP
jgi:hypothetical protein